MSVLIGADIALDESNYYFFENGDIDHLMEKEVKDILTGSTYSIFNLEAPLTDVKKPINKHGYHFIAPSKCAIGLKTLSINLLTLANNHIMDQDSQGLFSTMKALDEAGISYVGAGCNLEFAEKPLYFSVDHKRYGIYACAEHEYSIATENYAGANPFDPLETFDHVQNMKLNCDFIIVLYHGGIEYYPYPSPGLQKICRKFVQKGANLVICQHSHCIGCKEEYLGGTIVYGQGDFLSKHSGKNINTGILIGIEDDEQLKFIPIKCNRGFVMHAIGKEREEIIRGFEKRSEEIKSEGIIEKKYSQFANENLSKYVCYFSGKSNNILFRALNRISGFRLQSFLTKQICKDNKFGLRNYIECEAHRELFIKGLERCET